MTAGETTPLYKAVRHGDTIQVRRLLSDGADPNEPSGRFGTILSEAAARSHTPILRLLLEAGAKPTSYAVQAAAFGNHVNAVRLLTAAGAPVDAGGGKPPLLNVLHWSGYHPSGNTNSGVCFAKQAGASCQAVYLRWRWQLRYGWQWRLQRWLYFMKQP